jgi:hypothetical protein
MSQPGLNKRMWARTLLAGIALIVFAEPAWAILGRWARAAVVVGSVATADAARASAASASAAASQQAAASANAQSAANAAAASAQQSAAAAQQAAARASAPPPAPAKTPQQKLAELQSLYDQKLISQSDYQAAKTKVLNAMMN